MIKDSTIQKIKDTADILDVVSGYVDLNKTGNSYKGYCPIHSEEEPSFFVNENMGICKCFGCGFSGDSVSFIMEIENLEYIEAIKFLADRYGIKIEEEQDNEDLYELNKKITKFFHNKLLNAPKLMKYLIKERKINKDTIKDFNLGYAPNYDYLKNVDSQKAQDLGLYIKGDNNLFPRFRNRIMFPIKDRYGRYIGFNSRRLKSKDGPKYLNTNNTKIFKKSKIFYGLANNKKTIRDKGEAILVEGNMDVLRLYQIGIGNVLSPNGTSISRKQTRKLKRFGQKVILIFDGDKAGFEAAFRAGFTCLKSNLNVQVLPLPKSTDPDNFFKNNDKFNSYKKNNEKNFIDFCIDYKDISNIKKRYDLIQKFRRELKNTNKILRELIANNISKKMNIDKDNLLNYITTNQTNKKPSKSTKLQDELTILGRLFDDKPLIPKLKNTLKPKYFRYKSTRKIFKILIDNYNGNFHHKVSNHIKNSHIRLMKQFANRDVKTKELILKIKGRYIKSKIKYITKKMKEEEDENKKDKMFNKMIKLRKSLKSIK